ncbi:MAG: DUF692 domain-containing protein [Gammaproteobacteria bacterium]|nr:DUF692 domain-containing protein [Gammaproteobacteria bacterium]
MTTTDAGATIRGFGLGLRKEHYETILAERPAVDWFEALTENYLVPGGKPLDYLERIRALYPLVLHGVSLSIGGTEPIERAYLRDLRALAQRIAPAWISDHLCWTGTDGINLHDLLPLPYTEEALRHVVARVTHVQDFLGRQILLENVSSYVAFTHSCMSEWEFLSAVAQEADCLLLLDVNNVCVSAANHGFAVRDYLGGLPPARIRQIHLAGHRDAGHLLIDTHDAAIEVPVFDAYADSIARFGMVPTMIERDDDIPPLAELLRELDTVRSVALNPCRRAVA